MHFCEKCQNMFYIKVSDTDGQQIVHYCRNCGNENTNISTDNVSISKIVFKGTEETYHMYLNKYSKMDPTIPRINTMDCPNESCQCNNAQNPIDKDILYVRYDDQNLKYIYMCCHCDTTWKSTSM